MFTIGCQRATILESPISRHSQWPCRLVGLGSAEAQRTSVEAGRALVELTKSASFNAQAEARRACLWMLGATFQSGIVCSHRVLVGVRDVEANGLLRFDVPVDLDVAQRPNRLPCSRHVRHAWLRSPVPVRTWPRQALLLPHPSACRARGADELQQTWSPPTAEGSSHAAVNPVHFSPSSARQAASVHDMAWAVPTVNAVFSVVLTSTEVPAVASEAWASRRQTASSQFVSSLVMPPSSNGMTSSEVTPDKRREPGIRTAASLGRPRR